MRYGGDVLQVVALRSRVVSSTTNRQCRRRSRTQSIFCRRNRDSTFCGTWCRRSSCLGLFLCYIRYISLSFSFDRRTVFRCACRFFLGLAVFAKIGTCPPPKLSPFAPVIIPCLCFCALLQSKKSGSNHIACHKKAYTVDSVVFLLYNNNSDLSPCLTLGAFVNNCRCLRRRVVALSENCGIRHSALGIRHSAFGFGLRTNAQKCLCR